MHIKYLAIPSFALVGFSVAHPLDLAGSRRAIPTPISVETAKSYLAELVVSAPSNDPP